MLLLPLRFALLEREQPHHIRDIWLDYHDEREDCVADVLKEGEFLGFLERSRKWCDMLLYTPLLLGPFCHSHTQLPHHYDCTTQAKLSVPSA